MGLRVPRLGALCAALTVCVPLIHGYHPYAEDAGIYLAGIKYCLSPGLYSSDTGFVSAHVKFSVFAHAVALLASVHPAALMSILFSLYLLTTFFTLFTAGQIAQQLTANVAAQRWAVVLLAACLTLPVAGTSLMLMDPYVTARSIAFPCALAAFAASMRVCARGARGARGANQRDGLRIALMLVAAAMFHPLSAGYGAVALVVLSAVSLPTQRKRWAGLFLIAFCALGACVALLFFWNAVPAGYNAIAQSRTYWALSNWAWYELLGVIAPLILLLWLSRSRALTVAGRTFARAMAVAGVLSVVVSLLFVHADGPSFAVARVQPLRMFQYIYLALPLCLGVWMASRVKRAVLLSVVCLGVGVAMFATQRNIYANTSHVEWPGTLPANAWEQAFLWVRDNTPVDATLAVDAEYITEPGEDANNIRAMSERSVPADVSKDGGIAAIRPSLTKEWEDGVALQRNLATISDAERVRRLSARGIGWLILPRSSRTELPCPYENSSVSVCRIVASTDFVRPAK